MTRVQYFFSFVLATISFIAARSIQREGVKSYYQDLASSFHKEIGFFNFAEPDVSQYLPMGLQPFSALASLDTNAMLAISHDSLSVMSYSTLTNSFHYLPPLEEGTKIIQVACLDSTVVLLDTKQKLYFMEATLVKEVAPSLEIGQEEATFELLCFHPNSKRLLLLEERNIGSENEQYAIQTLRFGSQKISETPLFQFDQAAIISFIQQTQDLSLDEVFTFDPVSMAVHPQTNELYILSSTGSVLTLDQQGNFLTFQQIDLQKISQPRVLSFDQNGDLLLADGSVLHPVILKVKWQKMLSEKGALVK
jgi:hypothetical protein